MKIIHPKLPSKRKLKKDYSIIAYTHHRTPHRYYRYDLMDGKKNIAYAVVKTIKGNNLYLDGLYVLPEYRHQGLGKYLMDLVIANHNAEDLYVRARPFKEQGLSHQQLIEFYTKFEFKLLDEKGVMVRGRGLHVINKS